MFISIFYLLGHSFPGVYYIYSQKDWHFSFLSLLKMLKYFWFEKKWNSVWFDDEFTVCGIDKYWFAAIKSIAMMNSNTRQIFYLNLIGYTNTKLSRLNHIIGFTFVLFIWRHTSYTSYWWFNRKWHMMMAHMHDLTFIKNTNWKMIMILLLKMFPTFWMFRHRFRNAFLFSFILAM